MGTKTATIKPFVISEPTHVCTICDRLEDPSANIACNEFWLCDDCKTTLKETIAGYKKKGVVGDD